MQGVDLTETKGCTIFHSNSECQLSNDNFISLQKQVTDQKRTITNLENIIQIKDTQLESIHRDNERLTTELKRQQRCNRNLKQQLDDERFFYQREKDHFCEEMERHKNRCTSSSSKLQQRQQRELVQAKDSLEELNKQLRDELIEKSETVYSLCIKFLRMKHARDTLRQKLDKLLCEHLQVIAEMMEKLDEARQELNIIVSEKFQEPLPLGKAKYLQVVQRNTRLIYENASLKVQIQHLAQNIEKLKSYSQKPKTINVDARIIARLVSYNRRKRNGEVARLMPSADHVNKLEKTVSFSKASNVGRRSPMDHSGDAKVISMIRAKNSEKSMIHEIQEIEEKDTEELSVKDTQSAPEIVETYIKQDYQSTTSIDGTNSYRKCVEVKNACTNT